MTLAALALPSYSAGPAPIAATRKVICLVADDATQVALRDWCMSVGFDLGASFGGEPRHPDDFLFHLTLVASSNAVICPDIDLPVVGPFSVTTTGFAALGRDSETPVLSVFDYSGALRALRNAFIDDLGLEPTFADFKPHISLSYAWDGQPDLATLELPPFATLTFDRLYIAALD